MIHYVDNYLINPKHNITCSIIGAGGTGSFSSFAVAEISYVLQQMNRFGIDCVIYDKDQVMSHNCGRSRFSTSQIGLNKAVALATSINRYYGFDYTAVPDWFNKEAKPSNIYIICVDSAKERKKIYKIIRDINCNDEAYKPLYIIDAGNGKDFAQVILSTVDNIKQPSSKYDTTEVLKSPLALFKDEMVDDNEEPSCSTYQALQKQDLLINKFTAMMIEKMLWSMFRDICLDYQGIFFNLETLKLTKLKI